MENHVNSHISKKYHNSVDALAKAYDITALVFWSIPNLPRKYKYFLSPWLMEPAMICLTSLSLAFKTYNTLEKIIYLEIWKQYAEYLSCLRDITWEIWAIGTNRYYNVEKRLSGLFKNILNRQNFCIKKGKEENFNGTNIIQIQHLCETKAKALLLEKIWDTKGTYPKIEKLKSFYNDITKDYLNMVYSRNNGSEQEPSE